MNPLGEMMSSHGLHVVCTKSIKRQETRQDRINESRYTPFRSMNNDIIWSLVYDKWDLKWFKPSNNLIQELKRIW